MSKTTGICAQCGKESPYPGVFFIAMDWTDAGGAAYFLCKCGGKAYLQPLPPGVTVTKTPLPRIEVSEKDLLNAEIDLVAEAQSEMMRRQDEAIERWCAEQARKEKP